MKPILNVLAYMAWFGINLAFLQLVVLLLTVVPSRSLIAMIVVLVVALSASSYVAVLLLWVLSRPSAFLGQSLGYPSLALLAGIIFTGLYGYGLYVAITRGLGARPPVAVLLANIKVTYWLLNDYVFRSKAVPSETDQN